MQTLVFCLSFLGVVPQKIFGGRGTLLSHKIRNREQGGLANALSLNVVKLVIIVVISTIVVEEVVARFFLFLVFLRAPLVDTEIGNEKTK